MKPDLYYVVQAFEQWCKKNKWRKDMPLTADLTLEVLRDAIKLKDADKAAVEGQPAA